MELQSGYTQFCLDAVPLMFSLHCFIKNRHVETGEVVSPGNPEQPNSPIEAFSILQFTVICTRAVFEPAFQIVVTVSLTCGIYCPAEIDRIQKMEFESISLKHCTVNVCIFMEVD